MTWEAAPLSPWINARKQRHSKVGQKLGRRGEEKVEASVDPTAIDGSSQCKGLHQMSVCLSFSVSLTQGGAVVAEALGPWLPMTECLGTVINCRVVIQCERRHGGPLRA